MKKHSWTEEDMKIIDWKNLESALKIAKGREGQGELFEFSLREGRALKFA